MESKAVCSRGSYGFKGGRRSRGRGRARGKGNGKGRKGPVGRSNGEDAEANLQRFLNEYKDVVFQPRAITPKIVKLYRQTGKIHQNLLKYIQRHLVNAPDVMVELLTEMAEQSHWRVDHLNNLESDRQQRNHDATRVSMEVIVTS